MAADSSSPTRIFGETRERWRFMTAYERFEQVVALALSLLIAVVIVIALFQLLHRMLPLMLGGGLDLLDHDVFQALFGSIMTLLIAMEFKHSIVRVALRRDSVIQVKTVVLIALLALSRKFVIFRHCHDEHCDNRGACQRYTSARSRILAPPRARRPDDGA
jgi:uncharacterized membrane protein (DUF373 family)